MPLDVVVIAVIIVVVVVVVTVVVVVVVVVVGVMSPSHPRILKLSLFPVSNQRGHRNDYTIAAAAAAAATADKKTPQNPHW